MLKKILIAGALLVALLIGIGVYIVEPRNIIGIIQYGGQAIDGDLAVGDPAPNVPLVTLAAGEEAPLHDWVGDKPLVLVFGSFT